MVGCWLGGCGCCRLGLRCLMGVVVELVLGVGGAAGGACLSMMLQGGVPYFPV
jgi:hypothetical protein